MIRILLWLLFLPLQLGLFLIFLISDATRVLQILSKPSVENLKPAAGLCSILVLNWNGRQLLEESLPPLIEEVQRSGKSHQILVVDNGSTDDSLTWLGNAYPDVEILALEENLGFGEGNNSGVEAARHEIVVLLNNDMIVSPGFLEPLLAEFSDPEVFAVSSQISFPEGHRREETGNTRGELSWGQLQLSHLPLQSYHATRQALPVLWAGGGSSAFDKAKFLSLGGFSRLFSPCYLEDTDLGYRAWRRGWKVLLAPRSQVLHRHRSSSLVRFDPESLEGLISERKLWYLWKNYQLTTLLRHFFWFPINLTKWMTIYQYLKSLRKLAYVLYLRIREPRRQVGDKDLMKWLDHPLLFLDRFYPDRRRVSRSESRRLKILVVSAYLPHLGTHGGAGRVFQLLKRVAQRHEVNLITFLEGEKDQTNLQQVRPFCRRIEAISRNHFEPLSYFPYEPFEEFNSPEFRSRFEHWLTEEDFDIVHFEWTQMALYADLVATTPKLLTEVEVNFAAQRTLMNLEPALLRKAMYFYKTLQTLYREVELCRLVDRVICVTGEDQGYLSGYLPPDKLTVINTGVDVSSFDYIPEVGEPKSLLFVGAFRHYPNTDAMRYFCHRILPHILEQEPETHLYIVGSSPNDEILQLGKHPNITVTGFVEDIGEYYRLAQVVVVPLRTGVGIRGKILEAWSVGRATISTRLACQGIRAGHGENILIADDPDEFAMWTTALLRNPEHCRKLGKCGRQTVEAFYDWDLIAEEMVQHYEKFGHV